MFNKARTHVDRVFMDILYIYIYMYIYYIYIHICIYIYVIHVLYKYHSELNLHMGFQSVA